MAKTEEFLNFKITEVPKWRERMPIGSSHQPTISEMIDDINEYRKSYLQAKNESKIDREKRMKSDFELLLKFLLNVQAEEGIGLSDAGATKEIIRMLEHVSDFDTLLRLLNDDEIETLKKKILNDTNVQICSDTSSSQESLSDEEECNSFEPPCYPSQGDTEDIIEHRHATIGENQPLSKNVFETINLYRGYKLLAHEIKRIPVKKRGTHLGLLDVDVCILHAHKILMERVMDDNNTRPGSFSTNERQAYFKGIVYKYPRFAQEELVRIAIQTLVDIYVAMVEEIRQIPDSPDKAREKIQKSFKCASVFLFGFLTLHPFGDGNGRLARLLCSYSLFTFSPFLTPIFNVFSSSVNDDYVDALVEARKGLSLPENITTEEEAKEAANAVLRQHPSDLCAMIIESNRCMWREYLLMLDLRKFEDE